jgi:hypothetical protein
MLCCDSRQLWTEIDIEGKSPVIHKVQSALSHHSSCTLTVSKLQFVEIIQQWNRSFCLLNHLFNPFTIEITDYRCFRRRYPWNRVLHFLIRYCEGWSRSSGTRRKMKIPEIPDLRIDPLKYSEIILWSEFVWAVIPPKNA